MQQTIVPQVRQELETAIRLLPLAYADLGAERSEWVYTSDSSEVVYCVMRAQANVADIAKAGRWQDRRRFDITSPPADFDPAPAVGLRLEASHSPLVEPGSRTVGGPSQVSYLKSAHRLRRSDCWGPFRGQGIPASP